MKERKINEGGKIRIFILQITHSFNRLNISSNHEETSRNVITNIVKS